MNSTFKPKEGDLITAITNIGVMLIGKLNADGDMENPFELLFTQLTPEEQKELKTNAKVMPDMHHIYILERHKFIDKTIEQPFIIKKKAFITPYFKPSEFVIGYYVKQTTGIETAKNLDEAIKK